MSWEIVKLCDCCQSIADGDHQAPPKAESGVPFVTISNIDHFNRFDFSDTMFVPQMYYDKLDKKRKAVKGDVLLSVVGSFGIPVLIKDDTPFVFQRHIAILRPNPNIIMPEFLYYTMLSKSFYAQADAYAVGAAQRTISLTSLRKMKIAIPPLEAQNDIVAILSQYDSAIENNNKRIKLLEQMAENLYKEWFVRFRFPDYETAKFENGIPMGWNIAKVKVLVNRLPFGTLYKADDTEPSGNVIVIDQSKDAFVGYHNNEPSHTASVDNPIAIFGDHSCKFQLMICPFSLSENVIPYKAKKEATTIFLHYSLCRLIETTEYKRHWTELMSKKILVPPMNLQERFDEYIKKLLENIESLKSQNQNLTTQRDMLLPRLMSGKLEV